MGSVLTLNGAIKDGMDGDIVTNVQKNINGWVESGSGTVTLTYADGVNSFEFENGGGGSYTPPSTLQEVKDWYHNNGIYGLDEKIESLFNYNSGTLTNKAFGIMKSTTDLTGSSMNLVIFVANRMSNNYALDYSQPQNYWCLIYDGNYSYAYSYREYKATYNYNTNTLINVDTGSQSTAGYAFSYNSSSEPTLILSTEEPPVTSISKKYDLTLATEANKKYILTFGAKTSTGFTTGADAIKITNGTTTGTISLDGTSSNDFTEYKILFTAETTSVTIELDLSAVQSSSDIELDIKNVSFYEIGVAGGGGGGSDYEVVTEDFSFQCTSAYPETHEGATASRVVSVDNSNGYTYLQFTWSNNGAATGYGWVQGQYTFNGVTTQLYFQQNSISEIGDTVKLGIVGMGTTFDITFIVNATTNYQYSSSTAVLNITDVILTNE